MSAAPSASSFLPLAITHLTSSANAVIRRIGGIPDAEALIRLPNFPTIDQGLGPVATGKAAISRASTHAEMSFIFFRAVLETNSGTEPIESATGLAHFGRLPETRFAKGGFESGRRRFSFWGVTSRRSTAGSALLGEVFPIPLGTSTSEPPSANYSTCVHHKTPSCNTSSADIRNPGSHDNSPIKGARSGHEGQPHEFRPRE